MRLAIVHRRPVRKQLGDGVGTSRVEGRGFILRNVLHTSVELGAGSLIELDFAIHMPDRFEELQCTDRCYLRCRDRLRERDADKALGRQIEDIIRFGLVNQAQAGAWVGQVKLDQPEVVVLLDAELFKTPEVDGTCAPKRSMNTVACLQQLPRQIGSILACYA